MLTKLVLDFQVNLDLGTAFSGICSMTKLIPFENGRAVAFGWGTQSGNCPNAPRYQYWLAEICREGVSHRILPGELTRPIEDLMAPPADDCYLQAFKLGEKFGLLLSTEAVLLFSGIHDEPVLIPIENHFSVLGEPWHPSHKHDSYYTPAHCGNATDNFVPVVLSAPKGRENCGHHVCLLEIDQAAVSAKWLHALADGNPRTTVLEEYVQFHSKDDALPPGGMRLNSNGKMVRDLPPVIYDCAWIGNHWFLYVAGYNGNYNRYGIPLGVLTRNFVDLTLLEPVFKPQEQSFGQICASLDRMIVSPLRLNGPHKGKQTMFVFGEDDENALTPPRGYGKSHVQEYFAGHYWLTPNARGYNSMPITVAACKEG